MNNTINNAFINGICNNDHSRDIIAVFKNGREIGYTYDIFELLKTDKTIETIYDANTGEIIYTRDDGETGTAATAADPEPAATQGDDEQPEFYGNAKIIHSINDLPKIGDERKAPRGKCVSVAIVSDDDADDDGYIVYKVSYLDDDRYIAHDMDIFYFTYALKIEQFNKEINPALIATPENESLCALFDELEKARATV